MMNTGKEKCELLKSIRLRIANDNDVEYKPKECPHQICIKGTCSECDKELKWLTDQLRMKQIIGESVVLNAQDLIETFYG